MKTPLRILLLEDDTRDAGLIQDVLEADNFACDVIRTQTRAEFLVALDDDTIDLILADYTLPSFDGLSALMLPQAPGLICLSSSFRARSRKWRLKRSRSVRPTMF